MDVLPPKIFDAHSTKPKYQAVDHRHEISSSKAPEIHLDSVTNWETVTRSIIAGDRSAFETYYNSFYDQMLNQARRYSGLPYQDSLDLVHDAMLKAGKYMRPIADRPSLAAWSRVIMQSVCIDYLRKSTRERNWLRSNQPEDGHAIDPTDQEARLVWIESTVENLPAELRQIFSWRFRLGWSLKAIARQLGVSTGAIDGRLRRAIETLREQAKQEFGDEM